MTDMAREVTLTLLEDVATAVRAVLKDFLPSMPVEVEVRDRPEPSIVVVVRDDIRPFYPAIHNVKAVVRPTKAGRVLLGIGEE